MDCFRFLLRTERRGMVQEQEFMDFDSAMDALADAHSNPRITEAHVIDRGDPVPTGHEPEPVIIEQPPVREDDEPEQAATDTGLRDALSTYRNSVRETRKT